MVLDNKLSATALLSLAERYHAFSGSSLNTFTLPTSPGYYSPYGEAVQTVNEPAATTMITQFLGTAPNTPTTPPLDQNGDPVSTAAAAPTTPASTAAPTATSTKQPAATTTTKPSTATSKIPSYDPRPC